MSLNFQLDAMIRNSKKHPSTPWQPDHTTNLTNDITRNIENTTNFNENLDDNERFSAEPAQYSNFMINYSYNENKEKRRAKSSYVNKLSKVVNAKAGYQDKIKNKFFDLSSEITGVKQISYANSQMSWGLNKKSNNDLTLDSKPKVYDTKKYKGKNRTRPWSIDKSHYKFKNQAIFKDYLHQNTHADNISIDNSELNLEINEESENFTQKTNIEAYSEGLFQKQNKKYNKTTKNPHVKQHIQMHRPYYTLKTSEKKRDLSKTLNHNKEKFNTELDRQSNLAATDVSVNNNQQKLNTDQTTHQNFQEKTISTLGIDNDDPYFKGDFKIYLNLVDNFEHKRRAISSANTTYVINKEADRVQSKHLNDTNINRYSHLMDKYNEKVLQNKLHQPPKQKLFGKVDLKKNSAKKNRSNTFKNESKIEKGSKLQLFKMRPGSAADVNKISKAIEKNNQSSISIDKLPVSQKNHDKYMYLKQQNQKDKEFKNKIVNLRDLRHRMDKNSVNETKTKKAIIVDNANEDLIKQYKRLNEKPVIKEVVRVQKVYESPELFEQHCEAFVKLDLQAEKFLKTAKAKLAAVKGCTEEESDMAKYIDDIIQHTAKEKDESHKKKGGFKIKKTNLIQTDVHRNQTFTDLLTGMWEPDEKDTSWINPLLSYLKTAKDGIEDIKQRINNYTNDVHWSIILVDVKN